MPSNPRKLAAVAAAAIMALGLTACGGNSDSAGDPAGQGTESSSVPGGSSKEGRATGMTDDNVITVVKAATGANKVEIGGNTVRAYFDEGSKDDPAAGIYCSALDVVMAEDEVGVMVYKDGELNCADRYGND